MVRIDDAVTLYVLLGRHQPNFGFPWVFDFYPPGDSLERRARFYADPPSDHPALIRPVIASLAAASQNQPGVTGLEKKRNSYPRKAVGLGGDAAPPSFFLPEILSRPLGFIIGTLQANHLKSSQARTLRPPDAGCVRRVRRAWRRFW